MEYLEKPQLVKKSLFLERWSNAEVINSRLGVSLLVMLVISLLLLASLMYVITRAKPIYYIHGFASSGVAYPQGASSATVATFSSSWVLNWSNFTPATVESVYKHAQQFMSPRLLNQTKGRLKKDIEQVKSNNISSMFSLSQEPQVQEEEEGFGVLLVGDKGVYMGKDEIKIQKITYRLTLRSIPPTDWNPYGLIIENIVQEMTP